MAKAKLGIMGGTFNPIHVGHLVTAAEALSQFKLDKVVFMPAGRPPHKADRETLPPEERYLMSVIATAPNQSFEISRLEVDRKGPSYTIETVRELGSIHGPEVELSFITGADAVWEILTWKDAEMLAELCTFIAATRPGYSLEKFKKLHISPPGEKRRGRPQVFIMEIPALSISSTDIRRRVKEGRTIDYLVPESVANYIYKSGFYRG